MSGEQPNLFKPPKPVAMLRNLTPRQERIYALCCSVPGGIRAEELGALMHAGYLRHAGDERCEYCGRDGMRAINERAVRQRLVRRSGAVYEAINERAVRQRLVRRSGAVYEAINERDRADAAGSSSSQVADVGGDLPGSSFEDIFGDAA